MKYLVTGIAGFIGSKVAEKLLAQGHDVIGVDNMNDYYDVNLKHSRIKRIQDCTGEENFGSLTLVIMDISDRTGVAKLFEEHKFDRVIHLAAQAGVRYSIDNPLSYADSNLVGHINILEGCRHTKVKHLVYASSSSVYGLNQKVPFSTQDSVDHPVSLYAATKKSNELMAHTYSHLFNVPTTGLRFFTVYGEYGRPDMALFKFTKSILDDEPIDIYNNGDLSRDFTYIDDIVEGIVRIQDHVPTQNPEWTVEIGSPDTSSAPYRIYNIGNGNPVRLMDFVTELEIALGIEAKKNFLPMQMGDVYQTYADTKDLFEAVGYKPQVNVKQGVTNFVKWYREFYKK